MFEVIMNMEKGARHYFENEEEAYVFMLRWIQEYYKNDIGRTVDYSIGLNEGFKHYCEGKRDGNDWFGVGGIITCSKIEKPNKLAAPAQGISKDMFVKWVKEIKKIKDNYNIFLDQVYEIFGSSAQDAICNAMNEGNLIEMLADFVGDKNGTLSYYFYDLDCDLSEFDENVKLEGAPSVKDYGDLYDFIMYENGIDNKLDATDNDDDSGWEDYD